MDELVDRVIEMGFLYEGGQITLALDADDNQWIVTHSDSLDTQLNEYLTDKLTVTIEVTDKNSTKVTIPVGNDGGYGDSDYGETVPSGTNATALAAFDINYGDTGYEATDGDTNYGNSDYSETAPSTSATVVTSIQIMVTVKRTTTSRMLVLLQTMWGSRLLTMVPMMIHLTMNDFYLDYLL